MNAGGKDDALDNLCNPPGPVAAGSRQQLYAGWVHSHLAGHCTGCASHPIDLRAKARGLSEARHARDGEDAVGIMLKNQLRVSKTPTTRRWSYGQGQSEGREGRNK